VERERESGRERVCVCVYELFEGTALTIIYMYTHTFYLSIYLSIYVSIYLCIYINSLYDLLDGKCLELISEWGLQLRNNKPTETWSKDTNISRARGSRKLYTLATP